MRKHTRRYLLFLAGVLPVFFAGCCDSERLPRAPIPVPERELFRKNPKGNSGKAGKLLLPRPQAKLQLKPRQKPNRLPQAQPEEPVYNRPGKPMTPGAYLRPGQPSYNRPEKVIYSRPATSPAMPPEPVAGGSVSRLHGSRK